MERNIEEGPEYPKYMDNNDKLGHFKQRFYIKEGTIYLCGNSLGLCSKDAEASMLKALEYWKSEGVKIWNCEKSKFYLYSKVLAELMAPLVNADSDEIVVTGSTTSNIHKALTTFYKPNATRYKILVDDLNFPTDRYAVDSVVRLKNYEPKNAVKVVKSRDGKFISEDDVIDAMTEDVAIVLMPAVLYRSAQLVDMVKISKAAKERSIVMGWDLCHAIGAVEIDLKSLDIDFAIWCTYKYLNGGPGSTAAMYINRKHFTKLPGLTGWFGNKTESQFLLRQEFDHQQDASGWQIGTPTILSMATLEGALKIYNKAGLANIRRKSLHITRYLMFLIEKLSSYGFKIGNPTDDERRGGHICVEHDEGYRISLDLKRRGVVPDFRDPNVIRFTPIALYTSYEDVYKLAGILLDIVKTESYKKFSTERALVV